MKPKELIKFIIMILAIIAVSVFFALGIKIGIYRIKPLTSLISKGVDLAGGVHAEFSVNDPTSDISIDDAVKNIMQKQYARIRAYGYKDIRVIRTSENTISIDIPTAQDIDEILSVISQQGDLSFRYETGEIAIDGEHVVYAIAGRTSNNAPAVTFSLDEEGTQAFAQITSTHLNERLGIYLDDTELASPMISKTVTDGTVTITNVGTIESAEKLAGLISSGKLDSEIELKSQTLISPVFNERSFSILLFSLIAILALIYVFQIIEYRIYVFPLIVTSLLNILFVSVLILTANWTVFSIPVLYASVCVHFLFVLLQMFVYDYAAETKSVFGAEIRKKTYKPLFYIASFMLVSGLITQLVSITAVRSVGQILVYAGVSIVVFIIGLLPALMSICTKNNRASTVFSSRIKNRRGITKDLLSNKSLIIVEIVITACAIAVVSIWGKLSYLSFQNLMFLIVTLISAIILSCGITWVLKRSGFVSLIPLILIAVTVICADLAICRNINVDSLAIIVFSTVFILACLTAKTCGVKKWHYLIAGLILVNAVFVILSQELFLTAAMNLFNLVVLSLCLYQKKNS